MKHYGDITKINGAEVPPVNILTGGSPCQDLSVAGKRAGLAGERSGLFMEQIRIVKEMREDDRRTTTRTDEHLRPRYMVWENVAGAFGSGTPKGSDFHAVLEEIARVKEADIRIPRLEEGQRWAHAGCIMGDGWSIAWRLHDAQYWGVPQRRKRIALVADFGGDTAPQILFEPKSMPGDPKQSGEERQDTTTTTGASSEETISFQTMGARQGAEGDPHTLMVMQKLTNRTVYDWHRQDTRMTELKDVCVTAAAGWGAGGNNMPYVLEETVGTSVVRRFTPMECERLQGFPDGWTDIGEWTDSKGKQHKDADSPRYKALGNSIALPFWEWMAERMIKELNEEQPTMASLFDGIGGFPLVYQRNGCKPVWASEIEEFPIAVTKKRFPEEEE